VPITNDDAQPYVDVIIDLLFPVIAAANDPDEAARVLIDLGYIAPSTVTAFSTLSPFLDSLPDLIDALSGAADGDSSEEALLELAKVIGQVFPAVNAFSTAIQNNFAGSGLLTQTDILGAIVQKLADYLVIRFFEDHHPLVNSALLLAGIFQHSTHSICVARSTGIASGLTSQTRSAP
jgi:hypothetical protein